MLHAIFAKRPQVTIGIPHDVLTVARHAGIHPCTILYQRGTWVLAVVVGVQPRQVGHPDGKCGTAVEMAGIDYQLVTRVVEQRKVRILAGRADCCYGPELVVQYQVTAALFADHDQPAIHRHRTMLHAQPEADVVRVGAFVQFVEHPRLLRQQAGRAVAGQQEDTLGTHQQHPLAIREGDQCGRRGRQFEWLERVTRRQPLQPRGPAQAQHLRAPPAIGHAYALCIGQGEIAPGRTAAEVIDADHRGHPEIVNAHHLAFVMRHADACQQAAILQQQDVADALPVLLDQR